MEMVIVYPNKMDFPVMEDFGVPPPPLGMLEVTVRVQYHRVSLQLSSCR
jgi:hypothetical protein